MKEAQGQDVIRVSPCRKQQRVSLEVAAESNASKPDRSQATAPTWSLQIMWQGVDAAVATRDRDWTRVQPWSAKQMD